MPPIALAFVYALFLCAIHLAAPYVRRLSYPHTAATLAVGGGIAIAYVFLRLLPALQAGSERLSEALGESRGLAPFGEVILFAVALAGFLIWFAVERWAQQPRGEPSARGGAAVPGPTHLYAVQMALSAIANGLLGYTLLLQVRRGPIFALLFTLAMAMYFLASDAGLEARYQTLYERSGRFMLAAMVLVGWALSLVLPDSLALASILLAFLAGSVLLKVVRGQVPASGSGRPGWFAAGAVGYALVLLAVTWWADRG